MNSRKWQQVVKTVGNVFVDLGKLAFGSLILGSILKGEFGVIQIFLLGAAGAIVFFVLGIWFISMGEE